MVVVVVVGLVVVEVVGRVRRDRICVVEREREREN